MHVPGVLFLVRFNNFDRTTGVTRSSSNHPFFSLIPRTLPEKGGRAGNDVHLQQPSSYLVLINETCNVKPECWYGSEHGCLGPQCGGGDTDCMYHYCGWDDHALGVEVLRSGEWKHQDLGSGSIEIWGMEVSRSGKWKHRHLGSRSIKIWEIEVLKILGIGDPRLRPGE